MRQSLAGSDDVGQLVRFVFLVAFVVFTVAFLYLSWIPLQFSIDGLSDRAKDMLTFQDWDTVEQLVTDTLLNLVGLFPVGFAASALWEGNSPKKPFNRKAFGTVAGLLFALSLTAEGLQLFIPMRSPSLRDALTLEAGGILGICAWWATGARLRALMRRGVGLLLPGMRGALRYRWFALFTLLFAGCLVLGLYANPGEQFMAYGRHFSVRNPQLRGASTGLFESLRPSHSISSALVPSLFSSIALVAACKTVDKVAPS